MSRGQGRRESVRIWWIDQDRLAGSPNPTMAELERLRADGFATIISLLDEAVQPLNYDQAAVRRLGFAWQAIPIPDFEAPGQAQLEAFRCLVERSLAAGKVLVHCQGGMGRTGTMGAAYWVGKGLSAKEALAKVRQARPGVVETAAQEASLRALERGGAT